MQSLSKLSSVEEIIMVSFDKLSPDEALVFDVYRGTSHDGPGLRSTVFFKGCPLSCTWCHNPEGKSVKNAVWWDKRTCIGCGSCHEACGNEANLLDEGGVHIDPEKCRLCGECVRACPTKALSFTANIRTLDSLMELLLKDKAFYDKTGGGVTASGGEAMMQYEFVAKLFERLHEQNVATALDTCGQAAWSAYEKVLPNTDCILYDLKIIDRQRHKKFVGVDSELILDNARRIAAAINAGKYNAQLWIRTPLIPSATATEENLRDIGSFIANELGSSVTRWELPSFNNSCTKKYEKLGLVWPYKDEKLLNRTQTDKLKAAAISGGVDASIVFVTGVVAET